MCGRFTLTDPQRVRNAFSRFGFEEFSEYRLPRYNIAPSQTILGVCSDNAERVQPMRWGIDGKINARAERLGGRLQQRCIVFADGFYEWDVQGPVYFTLPDGEPFALAGIWKNEPAGRACVLVTCDPNDLVRPVHNRMPVLLSGERLEAWLSLTAGTKADVARLAAPYDAKAMHRRRVSTRLNNAQYDAPDVLLDDAPMQTSLNFKMW